jgi:methylmalonyl-CoA mutase cobalamin-binding domain/chain
MSKELVTAIADMDEKQALALTTQLVAEKTDPLAILDDCRSAMEIVGQRFEKGTYFLPELLLAGEMLAEISEMVKPELAKAQVVQRHGKVLIGTVKGDIHDIGKNLVAMMMEGAGFTVINLGINTDAEKFINAIHEHKPDILGMSALLTTTMPYMGVVINELKEQGLRDQVIVLVGGAPLNEAFAEEIGADAYCRDAAIAVETAKKLLAIKRGEPIG